MLITSSSIALITCSFSMKLRKPCLTTRIFLIILTSSVSVSAVLRFLYLAPHFFSGGGVGVGTHDLLCVSEAASFGFFPFFLNGSPVIGSTKLNSSVPAVGSTRAGERGCFRLFCLYSSSFFAAVLDRLVVAFPVDVLGLFVSLNRCESLKIKEKLISGG